MPSTNTVRIASGTGIQSFAIPSANSATTSPPPPVVATPAQSISIGNQAQLGIAPNAQVINLGTFSGGTAVVSIGTNRIFAMTLASDITTFNLESSLSTSPPIYVCIILAATQDSVGSRTIDWPDTVQWQGGYAPALSTAASATDVIQFISFNSGVSWFGALAFQIVP